LGGQCGYPCVPLCANHVRRPKNEKNMRHILLDPGTPPTLPPKTLWSFLEMGVRKRGSLAPYPGCVERDSKIKAERVDSGNHQGGTI